MAKIGNKHQVIAYVDKATFDDIEIMRGRISRSCFAAMILEEVITTEREAK